jgi:hypothetical protein
MKAQMVDDLPARMTKFFGGPLEVDEEALEFYRSISGKVVDLVFTGGDAFEAKDNNYWLPDEMWTEYREGGGS